jgi:hypothetical protein
MLQMSCVVEELSCSEEGLSSVELVGGEYESTLDEGVISERTGKSPDAFDLVFFFLSFNASLIKGLLAELCV